MCDNICMTSSMQATLELSSIHEVYTIEHGIKRAAKIDTTQ